MHEDPFKQVESHKSIETLKTESKKRLHDILHAPLTVENIEHFTDEALDKTVDLVKDLINEYQINPLLEGDLSLDIEQQEDTVCEKLELPNIPEILDRILEVKSKIDNIKKFLEESKKESDDVITPPDQLESQGIIPGDATYEKKKLIPRLLTLMYILETDFDINVKDTKQVQILEGKVTSDMMRQIPYVRMTIPQLNRAVYVCDEEGNASYVFDTEKLGELHISLDDLDVDGKQDKNSLIAMHPKIGVRVIQTLKWRNNIKTYLEKELPEQKNTINDEVLLLEPSQSEFSKRERSKHLSYEDWSKEVKDVWDNTPEEEKKGDIEIWYNKKRKDYSGTWPSIKILKIKYSASGFTKLTAVVGKESHLDKNYLPYEDWFREVNDVWNQMSEDEKQVDLEDWYEKEKGDKHDKTWPSYSKLKKRYSTHGFKSLNDVVGKENYREKNYLTYEDWLREVNDAWNQISENERPRSLWNWYETERKIAHIKTWPKAGRLTEKYPDFERISFYTLLEKEKNKISFPSYEDWSREVKDVWNQIPEGRRPVNILDWYTEERKKHINRWPHHLHLKKRYSQYGFISLNEVLDRVARSVSYLPYRDWLNEVKNVWDQIPEKDRPKNIEDWYTRESRKYVNKWPSYSSLKKQYKPFGFMSLNNCRKFPFEMQFL